ncbi:MAG: hypothetical protein H6873_03755 [Hyphomicrobiaceae bacterium]|nr:hypothetical protein [Hyphomicrobiaceae bacterium]
MPAELLRPACSAFFLDAGGDLRRLPIHPERHRSDAFLARFEDRAVFYDCFRAAGGDDILLVGPPPVNLLPALNAATFTDARSGRTLKASHTISRSTLLTRLMSDAGTEDVDIAFGGQSQRLRVQPNFGAVLEGARILTGMNHDNRLEWIADWAEWHVRQHKVDAVVLFDNGSTTYTLDELGEVLTEIEGLKTVMLFDWPFRFGARDNKATTHHYWAHFLQISALNLTLKRCAAKAYGLLNCDMDELVAPVAGDIFTLARSRPHGIAALGGQWVQSVVPSGHPAERHSDFTHVLRGGLSRLCPKKWAIDPSREWLQSDATFPYWHRIMGAPDRLLTEKPVAHYFHFRGISTNWKENRRNTSVPSALLHRRDPELADALKRVWPDRMSDPR